MQNSGIHILALNELDPQYPKELTAIAGYQPERLDRTCNGGGVSLYIRDSVKFKLRDDVPTDNLELICVEIQPPKSKSYLVVSWYRATSDPVDSFNKVEKVHSYLDEEAKEKLSSLETQTVISQKQLKTNLLRIMLNTLAVSMSSLVSNSLSRSQLGSH